MMIYALVLAGQTDTSAFPKEEVPNEALLPIAGKPMLAYVLEALLSCEAVEGIVVVGPGHHVGGVAKHLTVVEPGENIVENIRRGADAIPQGAELLLCTSDIPLITAEMLEDFLANCTKAEAGFYMPIVKKEVSEAEFPGADRTYAPLREGTFTAGNCFLISSSALQDGLQLAERFVEARKSVLRLAWLLGPSFIIKMFLKRLSLREVEDRVASLAGQPVKAVISGFPQISFDVDKPKDLEMVRERLEGRSRPEG